MPKYRITGPDGKKYNVSGDNAEGALAALQSHLGQAPSSTPIATPAQDQSGGDKVSPDGLASLVTGKGDHATQVKTQFDNSPWYSKAATAVSDMANLGIDGLTFGLAGKGLRAVDNAMGGNGDADYAKYQQDLADAQTRAGIAGTGIQVLGSVAPMSKAMQLGATATRIPGMIGKYGGALIDGSLWSGADAAIRGNDVLPAMGYGAAGGAGGQLAGKALGGITQKIADAYHGKTPIPDLSQLEKIKTAAYKSVDDAGVQYQPHAMDSLITGISDEMKAANISAIRHPKAASMLSEIQSMQGQSPTLTQLDQLRQTISRDVASSPDASERFFGKKMISNVDEFINSAGDNQLVSGNADQAANLISDARLANRRYAKTDQVLSAVDKADLRAASTGSGGNVDNAIRQNIRQILDNPKKSRSYNDAEKAAMEKVVTGTKGQNALRLAGKLSPSGNGLMAALSIGGAAANPILAVPSVLGIGAKAMADKTTRSHIDELVRLLATGSKAKPNSGISPETQSKIVKALTSAGIVGSMQVQH